MGLVTEPDSTRGVQAVEIKGWRIETRKCAILNSGELDSLSLNFPAPEMMFGNNYIKIISPSGVTVELNAKDALNLVESNESLKVVYSEKWLDSHFAAHSSIDKVVKPFDWTYQTRYRGSTLGGSFTPTERAVDTDMLLRREPIIFYDEVMLFEDELGDNGSCMLSGRVRVMNSCFLVLLRYFLRVDHVVVKVFDTRYFHDFSKNHLIREYKEMEMKFSDLVSVRVCSTRNYPFHHRASPI
jgi:type 2A phosphatase activator TIP41